MALDTVEDNIAERHFATSDHHPSLDQNRRVAFFVSTSASHSVSASVPQIAGAIAALVTCVLLVLLCAKAKTKKQSTTTITTDAPRDDASVYVNVLVPNADDHNSKSRRNNANAFDSHQSGDVSAKTDHATVATITRSNNFTNDASSAAHHSFSASSKMIHGSTKVFH